MHGHVSKHKEHAAEDCKSNSVVPQCQNVEAERAQDSRTGDFDIETVFVIDE